MHINYRAMLPESKTCDHPRVEFEVFEPKGESHVVVSVSCKSCPAAVSNAKVAKT